MVCGIRGNYDFCFIYEALQQEHRINRYVVASENEKYRRAREEALDEKFENAYY